MAQKPPNLLFILTDDQGAWALRCAGNADVCTPNLDRLAAAGWRFENFFCTSPVCSPARASLLTGRIPSAHGVLDWLRGGNLDKAALGRMGSDPYYEKEEKPIQYLAGMTCYTDVLKENGYACALAGKWHLGDSLVPQHGFDRWFTIGRGGCAYDRADVVENGSIRFENRYITDVIGDKALEFLDELAAGDRPFYLSVHFTAPHSPWDRDQHPKEFWDLYEDCPFTATPDLPLHPNQIASAPYGTGERRKELLRGYYTAISAMDAQVGRLLDALKAKSIERDTLVIFMADNGMNMGHHGIWGKGNGTFPFNMYDTAVKVPLLAAWPGHFEAGQVSHRMCSQYDFFPTLLELAGLGGEFEKVRAAANVPLPGKSFADVFAGKEDPEGWVVVFDEYGPTRMVRTKEWKYICRYPYGPDELYHLTEDPGEEHDLIGEAAFKPVVDEMFRRLTGWFGRYADPAMDGAREGVTGMGQLCRPGLYADRREVFAPLPAPIPRE